jgi:hypothetical protein
LKEKNFEAMRRGYSPSCRIEQINMTREDEGHDEKEHTPSRRAPPKEKEETQ